MNSHLSTSFLSVQCFVFLVLLNIWPSSETNNESYTGCRIPFRCGNITIGYPFWGGDRPSSCGHPDLILRCNDTNATITIKDTNYHVLKIDERTRTLTIVRTDIYFGGICQLPNTPLDQLVKTTIDDDVFDYFAGYENLTILYGCPLSSYPGELVCDDYTKTKDVFLQMGDVRGVCETSIIIPVSTNMIGATKGNQLDLEEAIYKGFELKWKLNGSKCEDCKDSGGGCGFLDYGFICLCPDLRRKFSASICANLSFTPHSPGSPPLSFTLHSPESRPLPFAPHSPESPALSGPAIKVLVGALIILSILLISGVGRKLVQDEDYSKRKENIQNMEAFVRNFESLVPQRFQFSDVKKMTRSFSSKLGQGGYGDVYKGKLVDGRLVAVKLLKESKGNGEEFINEVASICRTSHVNIVTLLGFCYTMNKRALIYEFMPNGSLDKFLDDKESSSTNHKLEWKTRYQIAIGIAKGLEYLHRGCNTRIVHFDIKPHNILLDEDFCPKISDFGLAKLCKQKESIISALSARGTAGYIAPEVFCRTFGQVSHKSDIYSYGMMILEMVEGRKNIDAIVSHTSEIYFPNWIYKQLEPGKDFEFYGVVTREEKEIAKKMVIVSMWCIQTVPSDRPSMGKVLEMLEGDLESLQVPPKPSLSLPVIAPKHSILLSSFSTSTSSHVLAPQEEEVCID